MQNSIKKVDDETLEITNTHIAKHEVKKENLLKQKKEIEDLLKFF